MGRVILTRLLVAGGVECVNGTSDLDKTACSWGSFAECVNGTNDLNKTSCTWWSEWNE